MSFVEKFILGLSGGACLMFLVFCLQMYDLKQDFKNQAKINQDMQAQVDANVVDIGQQNESMMIVESELVEDIYGHRQRIAVIEESLDPKNTRWAKIKQVREVIINHNLGNVIYVTKYASAVVDYSEKYDVSIPLILAVSEAESAFNPKAVSSAGARGIMQVMPATAKDEIAPDLGRRHYNLHKIRDGVQFGIWYIWKQLDNFHEDVGLAVRAYNCGPMCVSRVVAGEYEDYPNETKDYVKKVLKFKDKYEKMGL